MMTQILLHKTSQSKEFSFILQNTSSQHNTNICPFNFYNKKKKQFFFIMTILVVIYLVNTFTNLDNSAR